MTRQTCVHAIMVALLMSCISFAAIAGEAAPAAPVANDSACQEGQAETTARTVQARYDGIRDLAAGFEQESQSATFGGSALMNDTVKRGSVVFSKPGKMRWTYGDPEPSVVVSDGSTLWIYDVAGATATRLDVTAGYLTGAALQFLLGDGKILEEYDVSALECSDARVVLDLLPLEDATYERLGLVAEPKTGDILETSVVDLFGNVTVIRFQDVAVNQSPDAKTFVFEAPEGVEVINYAAIPGAN
ncbi:MAG: outer membrane lipoprotein carrier protein LolA [Myxococcota bacterium]